MSYEIIKNIPGKGHSRTKDLVNKTFGQWTVIKYDSIIKGNSFWYCRCSCGLEKPVKAQSLLNGQSTKCQKCANKTKDVF